MDREFVKQLQNKSEEELRKELITQREKLWQLSLDLKAGKVKNVADIARRKKAIAQILTSIRARFGKK
jgi:ribosomal protein L29